MMVAIDNPLLINDIKNQFNRPVTVFNLSSLYSGYIDVTDLCMVAPINNTGMNMPDFVQSIDFDIAYASAINNNQILFYKLMLMISAAYEGMIVIILIQHDPYRDAIMESLIKYVQQRYGYPIWIINDPEDILSIKEREVNPYGFTNLLSDIKIFDELYNTNRTSIE